MIQHPEIDTPDPVLYFAYGSNMKFAQMQDRCGSAKFQCIGKLPGYKLAFTRYSSRWEGGVADIVVSERTEVYGVVYTLSAKDLLSLDGYEGYDASRAADKNSYNRREIEIQTTDQLKSTLKPWTYFATKQPKVFPPSARYLQQIIEGATGSGLPDTYIAQLKTILVH